MDNKTSIRKLVPVMLCFFVMGFVDLVGIASNYVKADLSLNDATANLLPSLVFFWFLIFSVPTSMLMNRIGRKPTVLLAVAVTAAALLIPIFGRSFPVMLVAFSLLGIGNTLLQTSINPLLSMLIRGDNLASTITFGQFVKAIASLMAPYIAMWGATAAIPSLGLSWRVLFPIYLVVAAVAYLWLLLTPIHEERQEGPTSSFSDCFRLLARPVVLLSFVAIMCHVGLDVGINTTAPKILMERLGFSLNEAAFAASLYFLFRTIGSFTGSFFLRVMRHRLFFAISVAMMIASLAGLALFSSKGLLYVAIALVGYGNSNIFSMVFTQALLAVPDKQNEVSGLMIMGIVGGMVFPPLMGLASDAIGQTGAILVMAVGVAYLVSYIRVVRQ